MAEVTETDLYDDTFEVEEDDTIPEGWVGVVELVKMTLKEVDWVKGNDSGTVRKWRWLFIVRGGKYDERFISGETEPKFTAGPSRARAWAEVLLGREIKPGERIGVRDLKGLTCQASVGHRVLDDGRVFVEVDTLLPLASAPDKPAVGPASSDDDLPF